LHHIVVRAATRAALKGRLPRHQWYAIIGDDMVITNKLAGERYVEYISAIGGVVNLSKSRISATPGVTICEFAKSWFVNGVDITPASLRAVRSSLTNWADAPSMIKSFEEKIGKRLKAKKLRYILQKYWPKEANTLKRLIPVPQQVGGFGKPDSKPLVETMKGHHGNAMRSFIGNKLYTAFKYVTSIDADTIHESLGSDVDPKTARIALSPLLSLLRETESLIKVPYVVNSRNSFISWVLNSGTSYRTLLDWYDQLVVNMPVSTRERLEQPSLGWIRALEDDLKSSPSADADVAHHYAALELLSLRR